MADSAIKYHRKAKVGQRKVFRDFQK